MHFIKIKTKLKKPSNSKKAQVWVETVVYALIFLALMGAVLVISTPKIRQIKEKTILDQTQASLNVLNSAVLEARGMAAGTQIPVNFLIKKGQLKIACENEKIILEVDEIRTKYSEYDIVVYGGDIGILTTKQSDKFNNIKMTLDYSAKGIDLTYGEDKLNTEKSFVKAPTPYKFIIKNEGSVGELINIGIYEVS